MRMNPALRRLALLIPAAAVLAMAADADLETVRRSFENPPDDARIMMRWWWFGPGVTKTEIERELRAMKAGGMGGAEVQPVYPMALDDPETGFHNIRYLSDEFLDVLRFTSEKARELGLRLDLTLGSGWPFGGPHIPVTQAAGMLRCDRVPVPPEASSVRMPYLENGEKLLAVFVARGDAKQFAPTGIRQVPIFKGDWQPVGAGEGEPRVALFFISSRTGQMVKRAAVGAEGYVLDHYDRSAIENHLKNVGDRLMQAFGANPPYAVFSDSLEVFASDWTPNLLEEFRRRRGYDLTPYLPALIGDIGDKTGAIRHDWGQTLYELADDNYLRPVTEWAHRHGTRFRSQTYGMPPVTMSSNALVDLPEGEGAQWRSFSATRWASSASHLYGKPVTSSETWTYLHSPVFRATPLDMKSQADLFFLQGITQLVGHGWPYSPPEAGEPGWRFYAAAVFDDHNPWWMVMPDVARYLQRISFLLRQGKAVNDVAIYLPTADALAQFHAGQERNSINGNVAGVMGPDAIPQVLDAGFNFDAIDDEAIAQVGIPYPVLILPNVERMPLATLRRIRAYAEAGGKVVATRRTPSLAPGLAEAEGDTPRIRALASALFEAAGARGKFVKDEQSLGKELAALYAPDVRIRSGAASIGVVHRKVADGEIYFIVNTANTPVHTQAAFRVKGLKPEWWDPFSGKRSAARTASGEGAAVALDLEPYESRVLVYSANAMAPAPAPAPTATAASGARAPLNLSSDWKVAFGNGRTAEMRELRPWTDIEETRFFSGQATYEKTADVPEAWLRSGGEIYLNFGVGKPAAQNRRGGAAIESPVREAAQVYVNGGLAGSVWKPPYEVDVTGLLRAGGNTIRVVVANLGINRLAGTSLPNYRLLNVLYGERFQEQDLQNLQPVACGMLGPVTLTAR
jgi:hypothetical protein